MSEPLLLKGHPLNSAAAIREVIADMRLVLASPDMLLDMNTFGLVEKGVCTTCAGGSAVVFGMGASREMKEWTLEEFNVANYFDDLRSGSFHCCECSGYPVALKAQEAWCDAMENQKNPDFFPAWERFADAVETAEKQEAAQP